MPQIPDNLVPTTISYTKLLTLLNEEEIPMQTLQPDDVIDLGSGAVLTVLGPQRNYEDLNNCSLILRLDFGRNSFLFTGDAESTAEQDLLQSGADLSADLLKVGHHGSSTSSSIDFLRAVRPDFAVISCGTSNDYGHPHQAALDRLAAIGCQTLRTDLSGTIIITSNGRQITCSYAMEAAA